MARCACGPGCHFVPGYRTTPSPLLSREAFRPPSPITGPAAGRSSCGRVRLWRLAASLGSGNAVKRAGTCSGLVSGRTELREVVSVSGQTNWVGLTAGQRRTRLPSLAHLQVHHVLQARWCRPSRPLGQAVRPAARGWTRSDRPADVAERSVSSRRNPRDGLELHKGQLQADCLKGGRFRQLGGGALPQLLQLQVLQTLASW